jgi:iron complex outermembrane receptor protein
VTRTLDVITREQIAALPVHSVADVLLLASSIDVRARGERGVQSDFDVRGAGFGQMLVLVDGVRLNDVQSGHHNGDIPVPLDAIERIEILYGPGSSLFGADAFGGTVNIITRHGAARPALTVRTGSWGYAAGEGEAAISHGSVSESLAASADRSSGFINDRDYRTTLLRSRTDIGEHTDVAVSFLAKAFGAYNFYGGNAPSREWTNQTLITATHRFGMAAGWTFLSQASYRTHGDHFVFNELNPALSDNTHRTHTAIGSIAASRQLSKSGSLTIGAEGGADRIHSTNLGNHALNRVSGYGEWRQALTPHTQLDASLRVDDYSEFGSSWSPSAGVSWWPSARVRLRASAGRAFRVPTFTERYYHDPANLASPGVGPEHAWSSEGGVDLFLANGWMLQATVFDRSDHDVIDWLRPTVNDIWRTYNIRDVDTKGVELEARRTFRNGAFVQAGYTRLDQNATPVNQLSKYVLDYAPHSFVAAASVPVLEKVRVAPRLEYRRRVRSTGTSDYALFDARVSRPIGSMFDVYVEGTNLFNVRYQEVAGVDMPGAAVTVALSVRPR